MDLNEIKKLIEQDGAKIIIVENGEPVMVITSFADYQKGKMSPEPKSAGPKEREMKVPSVEKPALPPELNDEELKIEDLPF